MNTYRSSTPSSELLLSVDGNFSLLWPYHGEHGPKAPVTLEYIVLQRVPRKRGMYVNPN
jgi:hypothetical protein